MEDTELEQAFALCEQVNAGQSISFFEITTAAAFLLFAEHPADYLLLEVGLGGRFDTTNVVEHPLATVVTPVSMDHPEFLGSTVGAIAFEKAGILKRGSTAILAPQSDEALNVLLRQAAKVGNAPPLVGGQDYTVGEERGRLVFQDERGLLDLPLPRLAGRHQHLNAANRDRHAAHRRARPLGFGLRGRDDAGGVAGTIAALETSRLPTIAPDGAELWLDGGHNAEGGRILAEALAEMEERHPRPLVLVCGMLTTKDPQAFLKPFAGLAQEVIAVPVTGQNAGRDAEEIARLASKAGIEAASCSDVGGGAALPRGAILDGPSAHPRHRFALSRGRGAGAEWDISRVGARHRSEHRKRPAGELGPAAIRHTFAEIRVLERQNSSPYVQLRSSVWLMLARNDNFKGVEQFSSMFSRAIAL